MITIDAADAQAEFERLLDDVGRGETIVITRQGRPIARLASEASCRRAESEAAIESIMILREQTGRTTVEEILSARDEGRR